MNSDARRSPARLAGTCTWAGRVGARGGEPIRAGAWAWGARGGPGACGLVPPYNKKSCSNSGLQGTFLVAAPVVPQPGAVGDQIAFARHNFDNHQALLRFTDTKAGAFLTVAIFLAGSDMPVVKDAVHKLVWQPCSHLVASVVFVASGLGFMVAFLGVVATVHAVIKTRGARHYAAPTPGQDLLWQEHVLGHGSQAAYFAAVQGATPNLILRNLTDQVYELASISVEKMATLVWTRRAFWIAFFFWTINVVVGLFLMR